MSIRKNLKRMHAAITKDMLNDVPTLSAKLNRAGVKALTGGITHPDWKSYMAIFADNEAQLERLTVPKDGEPTYLRQMRAYIVSNSICDIFTNGNTGNQVVPEIDQNPVLDETPDDIPAQFRPDDLKMIPDV